MTEQSRQYEASLGDIHMTISQEEGHRLFGLLDDFLDRNEDALLEDVALELRVLLNPPVEI